jgi:hypothetical protein
VLRRLQSWLIGWRFKRLTRAYDRRIEAARKAHRPVRHIQAAKSDFVHALLRAGRP